MIAPTCNDEFKLRDGFYSVSDIKEHVECIIKKHETLATNPPIHIYINRINNRLMLKLKHGYKLQLKRSETMKLFCSPKINRQNKEWKNYIQSWTGQSIQTSSFSPMQLSR